MPALPLRRDSEDESAPGQGPLAELCALDYICQKRAPPSNRDEPGMSRLRLEAKVSRWASKGGRRGKGGGRITSQVSRRRLTAALSSPMTTA